MLLGLLAILMLALALVGRDSWVGVLVAAPAVVVGFAVALMAGLRPGWTFPFILACAAFGLTTYVPEAQRPDVQLALAVGAGLGAFAAGAGAGSVAAVAMAGLVAAGRLGSMAGGVNGPHAALAFGLLVGAGLLLRSYGSRRTGEGAPWQRESIAWLAGSVVLLGFGAWFLANRFIFIGDVFTLFFGGALIALVIGWMSPDAEDSLFRFLLAALVWIGVATVAFALRRGFGVSMCLLGALSGCLLMSNRRALLSLGPLVALAIYRLFREAYPDARQAFDIGQHYAMIGLLVGVLLPLLPLEWERAYPMARSWIAGAGAWLLLL
ncbi:MAG TPA: hypothetical protein VM328_03675, partial [Fimbriimonadaceae bacterium]|nr:hypothetical protein [Fimbriimonadaceae bacterium]